MGTVIAVKFHARFVGRQICRVHTYKVDPFLNFGDSKVIGFLLAVSLVVVMLVFPVVRVPVQLTVLMRNWIAKVKFLVDFFIHLRFILGLRHEHVCCHGAGYLLE